MVVKDYPLEGMLALIGGRWKCLLLNTLMDQPHRYGELHRALPPISEKVLIHQLRELEADGLVHREVYPAVPAKVEYSLTPYGETLRMPLEVLCTWAREHMVRQADGSSGQPAS